MRIALRGLYGVVYTRTGSHGWPLDQQKSERKRGRERERKKLTTQASRRSSFNFLLFFLKFATRQRSSEISWVERVVLVGAVARQHRTGECMSSKLVLRLIMTTRGISTALAALFPGSGPVCSGTSWTASWLRWTFLVTSAPCKRPPLALVILSPKKPQEAHKGHTASCNDPQMTAGVPQRGSLCAASASSFIFSFFL